MPSDATVNMLGYVVRLRDIPDYNTSVFREWLTAWNIWEGKNLLPFPGSWTEQPAHVIDILTAFDGAHGKYTERESRRRQAAHSAKKMKGGRR